ncbi:hypothetical protein E2C01_031799 [Portunus trituberculatus]|uniref:Uncharacterized protein n=1 Tax=Portunus trituberculatus TaxID=210409 RepID=A0A5B7EZK3_PORTR|nr:hypothetical protein [Portunus trituberculatus]
MSREWATRRATSEGALARAEVDSLREFCRAMIISVVRWSIERSVTSHSIPTTHGLQWFAWGNTYKNTSLLTSADENSWCDGRRAVMPGQRVASNSPLRRS